MKAPALGTSSNAMRRSKPEAGTQVPEGPPTCTAWASRAPQSARICAMGVPIGYS